MKKIPAFLLFWVFVILGIPFLISLFWTGGEVVRKDENITVTVFKDSGDIETVDVEEYLFGVLAGEMPASFHIEALKAQAVAARTYILNKKESGEDNQGHPDADICTDSTHCKAWLSDEEIRKRMGNDWHEQYGDKMRSAIEETRGEIMLYAGEPIVAVFHSTGGGRTENSEDVWGGSLPYLKSVESPGDETSPKFKSEVTMTRAEFEEQLGVSAEIGEAMRSEGGAVKTIMIGGREWSGGEIRAAFGLNSANFEIEQSGDNITFYVKGCGHGVGMSQYGANALAEQGATYDEILKTYYSGVEIAIE